MVVLKIVNRQIYKNLFFIERLKVFKKVYFYLSQSCSVKSQEKS